MVGPVFEGNCERFRWSGPCFDDSSGYGGTCFRRIVRMCLGKTHSFVVPMKVWNLVARHFRMAFVMEPLLFLMSPPDSWNLVAMECCHCESRFPSILTDWANVQSQLSSFLLVCLFWLRLLGYLFELDQHVQHWHPQLIKMCTHAPFPNLAKISIGKNLTNAPPDTVAKPQNTCNATVGFAMPIAEEKNKNKQMSTIGTPD